MATAKKEPAKKTTKVASSASIAKSTEAKAAPKRSSESKLNVTLLTLDGKEAGNLTLPEAIFGAPVNEKILSQALRVYMNNQKGHWAHTKTRGEVKGSTKKMGSQKGSGHARHGSIKAPIFVGGGIALGARSRVVRLDMPKKMKQLALVSALSKKVGEGEVMGIDGLTKASGKTAQFNKLVKSLHKKSILFVTDAQQENVIRGVRNLQSVGVRPLKELNALEVVSYKTLVIDADLVKGMNSKGKE